MDQLIADVLGLLKDDLVSHGFFVQVVSESELFQSNARMQTFEVLSELLSYWSVEIGNARNATPDHVEFVAWTGPVTTRLARAKQLVDVSVGPDGEFAFWLCLRENVDRFESPEQVL